MTAQDPVGRIRFMDRQRVNLDGFAVENPELGLTALRSPHDPESSLVVTDGRVTELDGVPEAEFDSIDTYIARHGLDLSVADEVMALSDVAFARLLVDPAVPRHEIIRLSAGATPAKLTRVLALLRPPALVMAMTKLRARCSWRQRDRRSSPRADRRSFPRFRMRTSGPPSHSWSARSGSARSKPPCRCSATRRATRWPA